MHNNIFLTLHCTFHLCGSVCVWASALLSCCGATCNGQRAHSAVGTFRFFCSFHSFVLYFVLLLCHCCVSDYTAANTRRRTSTKHGNIKTLRHECSVSTVSLSPSLPSPPLSLRFFVVVVVIRFSIEWNPLLAKSDSHAMEYENSIHKNRYFLLILNETNFAQNDTNANRNRIAKGKKRGMQPSLL